MSDASAGTSRRKGLAIAGLLVVLLGLVGCGFVGPSDGDVRSVEEALVNLPEGWTAPTVSGDNSSSEGITRDLTIRLEAENAPTVEDLRTILETIVSAVPRGAAYNLSISIRTPTLESRFVDLSTEFRELGLGDTIGDHSQGDLVATRAQISRGLKATSLSQRGGPPGTLKGSDRTAPAHRHNAKTPPPWWETGSCRRPEIPARNY